MPFCVVKGHLLTCKRACFAMQKGTFYNPLCNLLILRRLQSRFLMIMSWFANNNTLQFVRVFQKPLPDPLRRERGIISGIPRYVWEDIKRCLRVLGLVLKKKSKQVTYYKLRIYELADRWIAGYKPRICELTDRWFVCYKLRIYELTDRWIANDNYEFTNWQVDGLHVIICDFMSKK